MVKPVGTLNGGLIGDINLRGALKLEMVKWTTSRLIGRWANWKYRPSGQSASQSAIQPASQTAGQSARQPASQRVSHSATQPANQPESQEVGHPFGH